MTTRTTVAESAAHLDVVSPGWWKVIDTNKLNLESGRWCILGQLKGSYAIGIYQLDIQPLEFAMSYSVNDGSRVSPLSATHQAWLREIQARANEEERKNRMGYIGEPDEQEEIELEPLRQPITEPVRVEPAAPAEPAKEPEPTPA